MAIKPDEIALIVEFGFLQSMEQAGVERDLDSYWRVLDWIPIPEKRLGVILQKWVTKGAWEYGTGLFSGWPTNQWTAKVYDVASLESQRRAVPLPSVNKMNR